MDVRTEVIKKLSDLFEIVKNLLKKDGCMLGQTSFWTMIWLHWKYVRNKEKKIQKHHEDLPVELMKGILFFSLCVETGNIKVFGLSTQGYLH